MDEKRVLQRADVPKHKEDGNDEDHKDRRVEDFTHCSTR